MAKAQEGASGPSSPKAQVQERATTLADLQIVAAVVMADIMVSANDSESALLVLESVGIKRSETDNRLSLVAAHFLQERGLLPAALELPELNTGEESEEAP